MPELLAPAPFVVGVPRSGTTLLRLMLDRNSELAIPGETHFLPALAARLPQLKSREDFLAFVVGAQTWPNLGVDEAALRRAVHAFEPFTVSDGLRCFYRLYAKSRGKARWGDKTPPYRSHLKTIEDLLPEAHFVHVIRDGRDAALSLRGLWWGPGDDIEAQAHFWVEQITHTRQESQQVAHYAEVRYEDLVSDPEPTLRGICDYLALRFEPGMLEYYETAAGRLAEYKQAFGGPGSPSDVAPFIAIHERVKQPPDPGRIGRWRAEMTEDEVFRYQAIAGPLLRECGYEAP